MTDPRPEQPPPPGSTTIGGDQYNLSGDFTGATVQIGADSYAVAGLANPYLGLRAYTYAERERYAGREREIVTAVAALTTPGEQRALLFLTGASGSGKSSFAQAGLLPALEAHYQARNTTVRHAVMRPARQPLAALADALLRLDLPPDDAFAAARPFMVGVPSAPPRDGQVCLLVIDQFEELFTQADPAQRDAFFAILAGLPPFAQLRMHLIATMRADYLPELFERRELYEIAKQGIDLRAMTPEELSATIQRPVQLLHPDRRIEPALVEQLAADAAADAAYLPLLQVTLEDLWRRGSMTRAAYSTLTAAIRQRADEVFAYEDYDGARARPRPAADQQAILAILLDLVEVSLDDDARRDVRRRRSAAELARGDERRLQLIDDLASARLLSKSLDTRGEAPVEMVDIIHETLIANWDRLRLAIAEQREALQQRVRFEQALGEWEERAHDNEYLLAGVWLAEAEALDRRGDVALQGDAAQALLKQSVAHREAARQRLLRISMIANIALGSTLVVALIAGILVAQLWAASDRNARRSRAQFLVAEGQRNAPEAPLLGLRLALEGLAGAPPTAPELPQLTRAAGSIAATGRIALLSSDAATLAVTHDPATFVLRHAEDGAELRRAADGAVIPIATGGRQLNGAACAPDGAFCMLVFPDAAELRAMPEDRTLWSMTPAREIAFSPDGMLIRTTTDDAIEVRRVADGSTLLSVGAREKILFAPDWSTAVLDRDEDPDVLRRLADGADLADLGGDVDEVSYAPDGAQVAVTLEGRAGAAIYATADGAIVRDMGEGIFRVRFSPGGSLLSVEGRGNSLALFRIGDETPLLQIDSGVDKLIFLPDDETLIIDYDDLPGELRRASTPDAAEPLPGIVADAIAHENGSAYVLRYDDRRSEIRWTDRADVVALADQVRGGQAYFSADGATLAVRYAGTAAADIRDIADGRLLVALGTGAEQIIFAPDAPRAVVRYASGAVYLIDMAWLRALGEDPAALGDAELTRISCEIPLANGLWTPEDERRLIEALGEWQPTACS
jgi:ABC-type dipeptide/oligopeptide/nickel transport system ATPase component